MCSELNLTQIIDKPTRVTAESESLIDIIMVSSPVLIKECGVQDVGVVVNFFSQVIFGFLLLLWMVMRVKQRKTSITTKES